MWKRVLLVGAAFAAGLGVGYVSQPAPDGGRADRPVAAPAGGRERDMPERSLHEQLLSLPTPETPVGDGVIRGYVRDDHGAPLEGALIVASLVLERSPHKSRKGCAAPEDRDLEQMVRAIVWEELGQRQSRRTARTRADGSYELTGMADTKWQLRAYKEGFDLQPQGSSAYNVEPGAIVDFAGGSLVRIDVDVLLPDGSRPTRADIRADSRQGNTSSAAFEPWLPGQPWIELKPNTYELTAEIRGAEEHMKSRPQAVKAEPGATPTVVLRLESRPALRIRVIPPDGIRLRDWAVWALRFLGEVPPDPARLREEGREGGAHGTPEHGIVWDDIEAGAYLVGAAYSSNSPIVVSEVVHVGQGRAAVDLRFPTLDAKDFVAVRVRDPDGAIPRDVGFFLGSSPKAMGTPAVLERTDGAFLLHRGDPGDDDAGRSGSLWVRADSRSLGSIDQECEPGAQEVALTFERPGLVDVEIVDYGRSPHAGWLVLAIGPRGQSAYRQSQAKPGPEGKCRLGPTQPGAFEIVVHALVDANTAWPAVTLPIDVRSGGQTRLIDVPTLHTVTIRWPGKAAGRSFSLHHKSRLASWITRQVKDEVTTIERVPPGPYELRPFGGGKQAIEFEVPQRTEITIE